MSAYGQPTKGHGKSGAATVAPSMNPQGGTAETSSATDRAGDVPAAVELGKELVKDEAQLRADYDLTYREIRRRLHREKLLDNGQDAADHVEDKKDGQGNENG